ncbi:hypothetical protein HHI36_006031 [Cryptolaemus montrouzieri]|uniref:Uncharacterized protein n=1 Tax=Cryptolaemus montrouzieri TaxID=559131 RepID=A0ABD2NWD1_9CUCU
MVRTYKPKTDRKISMKKALKMQYVKYCQNFIYTQSSRQIWHQNCNPTTSHRKSFEATRPLSTIEASSSLQAESSLSQAGPSSSQIAPSMEMAQIASSSAHTTTAALSPHTATATSSNIYGSNTSYHDLTDENTHNTQDLHFVDSEASQNNEVVDREQNKTPTLDADPVSVSDADDPLYVSSSKAILTPEVVRPYPKKAITDSVLKRKGREKGRSRIYTETPEKNRLESLRNEKNRKRELQKAKQHAKELKTAKNLLGLTEPKKKKKVTSLPSEIDSDSSQDEVVMTSDSEDIEMPSESEEEVINEEPVNPEHINIGDFLLIKFEKKKTVIHYIAKVVFKYSVTEYEVLYLRKKQGLLSLYFQLWKTKQVWMLEM